MAKQEIDIGVEGNDGTGNSIRESFRKVNENFNELYAIFGLGGQISFTNLDDVPDEYTGSEGKVVLVKQDGTGLDFYELVSNAGTNDPTNVNNSISFSVDGNKLVVRAVNTRLSTDPGPSTDFPLRVGSALAYSTGAQALLLNDSNRNVLVSNFNTVHGTPSITEDNLVISKGFADSKYVNITGDTMTGALTVPAGATGSQAPRVSEVVKKSGDTMSGLLTLSDHPTPFNGLGTPNSSADLQAATKFYVDSRTFSSATNLFVSTSGDDAQTNTPAGREGRSESYAYRSVAAACEKAERIQQASAPDIGPYIQDLTYTESLTTFNSYVFGSSFGYTLAGDQSTVYTTITANKTSVINAAIAAVNSAFPDFVYNETICRRDLGLILDAIKFDIGASTGLRKHNYLSRYSGLRYFENPSGEFAISTNGQYTETAYTINQAKIAMLNAVQTALGTTSNAWYTAVSERFDDILDTIDSSTPDPELVESTNYYTILAFSGSNKFTDQSGDPSAERPNVDIFPGKVIRGKTTGAIGQIITYTRGSDVLPTSTNYDVVELQLLEPIEFDQNEDLEFGNLVKTNQITVRVESGIYDEQFPIRVPENTSIKGDEFRRSIIRPADGVSTSSYARTYFYRDAEIDGLSTATGGEIQLAGDGSGIQGYYGYHYLLDGANPLSTPKNNDEMDVFLMNDASLIRNITCQRHGGFMMVLDPTGSIQTRSPYAQTCTSFSKSQNKKAFHGGMFIDGYVYNMPMDIVSKSDNFTLEVQAASTSGLGIRKPKLPCSFFIGGARYQVNAIAGYDPDDGTGTAVATLILDASSNDGVGYDNPADSAAESIVLQGAGNKSMLANDYTQINDLGYGVIANNSALSELVSVFTYYCHCGYYSRNGSQIRSLTGNNSYGTFGMVAEGSDLDEIPRPATLTQDLVQPVKMYVVDTELVIPGDVSALLSVGEQISQQQGVGLNAFIVNAFLAYFDVVGGNTRLYLERKSGGSFNTLDDVYDSGSTILGKPSSIVFRGFNANENDVSIYVYDVTNYPMNASELEILHSNGVYQPYEVVSVTDTELEIPANKISELCDSTNVELRKKIWRFDLSSGVATADTGIQVQTAFGTLGVYRAKQQLLFNGVTSAVLSRPSTALVFNEYEAFTYRTIAFENTIVSGIPVVGIQAKVTIDDNFAYIDLLVVNEIAVETLGGAAYIVDNTIGDAPAGGTTLGSTPGDLNVAIARLEGASLSRIVGMLFTWAGKTHRITGYSEASLTSDSAGFGIITFNDEYSINPIYVGTGLAIRADSTIGNNISLKAGLKAGVSASFTVNISTTRATSHDFLDIGTGGYNTSNYPDRIYGGPIIAAVTDEESIDSIGFNSKAQVQERTKGRVFFASTDQDGFFRVGRFFTVDQGTGRVTFNAALVLTNIDGIGFKRGVRVNEFSPDATFTNATGDSVPTETAVEGYINRRLGWDRDGDAILLTDIIGGGAIRKAGDTFTGNLSMGGNQIRDLAAPSTPNDAANKFYVDGLVAQYDELEELTDVAITTPANAEILVYNSLTSKWTNELMSSDPLVSDVTLTYSAGTLSAQINAGVIDNANISASAAIAQSKLSLSNATAAATSGAATKGIASFSNESFDATSGFITVKALGISNAQLAGSIANNKLSNSSITVGDGTSSTAISLGGSITFSGTANEVEVDEAAGTVTIGLPATINANTTGNAATATRATAANTIRTVTDATNATRYITFVDSDNGTNADELLYTDAGLTYNPNTNALGVGPITVTGAIIVTGNVTPGANSPSDSGQNLGASGTRWNTVWATTFNGVATEALYADLAENYLADAVYESGTVLVFGGNAEVTLTNVKGDRRVAGVVTTNPAHLMNSALEGEFVTGVALQGRVPVKVLGQVQKGDLIVTSAIVGYGIVDNDPRVGTVIGKAVANKEDDGKGVVEVVVGRV
jgi:hypothetical protein